MSGFSIESTARLVGKLLLQEVKYLGKVREDVEELKSELEWMQCFLIDADGKQNNDALVCRWMSEICDIAHEAEDIIQTCIVFRTKEDEDGFMYDLMWLACYPRDAITLHHVGPQIAPLTSKISKLSSRLQTYGVRGSYDFQSSHKAMIRNFLAEQRRTYSHDEANYVVGLEAQIDRLIHQLQAPPMVVVVYGMGGIGKTTLAKQEIFAGVAWAYVSQKFQRETIFRDILNQLIPEKNVDERKVIKELSDEELPGKLSSTLKQSNYLVVLDDVWTVDDWNLLAPAFPIREISCHSKLLITTRNPQILSGLCDKVVSTLDTKTLDNPSDWKLLQNKGNFTEESLSDPLTMKEVARKMLDHCDGNPLAIVTLGGVLATKKSLQEWESVLDNLQSHLQGDGLYSRVYDVLAMGYYDLPYHVKPCFLHMGHFPEDFEIGVERIHNLWIAEGIVSSPQDGVGSKRTLEDIAYNYLNQLVQKGMIQVVDMTVDGMIKNCSLHDLMRDKCLEMTIKETFLHIVDIEQKNASAGNKMARRLTMHVGKEPGQSVLKASSRSVSSLRSILFISTYPELDRNEVTSEWIRGVCKKFKLLRILDFEGVIITGTLPSEVGNLIFLTYLSLKGTHITELPSSIGKLRSLLILDLRVKKVKIKLPNVLWKMSSLCHLYFPWKILSKEEGADTDQGYVIENGNTLLISDTLGQLERVDNVDLDRVDENGLVKLSSIRKLSTVCKHQRDGLMSILNSRNIKHLNLQLDAGLLIGKQNTLLSTSESLRILHITAERDPPTILTLRVEMFPRNLGELEIWYCLIEHDPMPILEKLQNLKVLRFILSFRGKTMNCSSTAFPELTYLELDGLNSLRDWNVSRGGFPKLQKVGIYNCPLNTIPDALPPNISIGCTPGIQRIVDEFHNKVSKGEPGSSTAPTVPSTW